MTEYDYSPDAYERYLATQQRIARWVDNTNQYPPSNPFVPSPSIDPKSTRDLPSESSSTERTSSRSPSSHYSKSRSRSSSDATYHRPSHSRSQTVPTLGKISSAERPRLPPRHTSSSSYSRPTHHSSHSSSSRYTSVSNRTRTSSSTCKTVTPNKDGPTYIKASDKEPILVPIDGGRGGYVIVPPRGKRMEVLNPSYATPSRDSEMSRNMDGSSEKSLLKRLLSGLSSPGGRKD